MRLSTKIAADVLGLPEKRLDNLLVRSGNALGLRGKQGRSRQLNVETIELLAVTLLLRRDTGASLVRAIEIARELLESREGSIPLGVLATLHFDLARLRSVMQQALADALEGRIAPRRGRPPKG